MRVKILVIEDDFFIAKDIVRLISKLGVESCIAYNFEDAIKLAENFLPDIIISDINLGEYKTGIDIVEYLKKKMNPKIVFLTSLHDPTILKKVFKLNIEDFIVKPYKENQFIITINLIINSVLIRKEKLKKLKLNLLTSSELRIVHNISEGKTSKQIAKELFVSLKTVEKYRTNIGIKLEIPEGKNSLMKWVLVNYKILIEK